MKKLRKMKKIILNNLYQSSLPPTDTSVLWVKMKEDSQDIESIFRFRNGFWEPYLVSVDFMKPEEAEETKTNKERKEK